MRYLRELIQLRRRSDKVKAALLLFLLGALLGAMLLSEAFSFLGAAAEPVEYILACGTEGALLEGKLQTITRREGVVSAGRQKEHTLVSGQRSLTVAEVPPEYMSRCFGLSTGGAGREFFLGSEAFASFCGGGVKSPARLSVLEGEDAVSGTFILCKDLPQGAALTKGTSVTLRDAESVRVMLSGRDFSGLEGQWLEGLGFSVVNREVLTESDHRLELTMTKLQYGGLAFVLSLALGWQLFAAGCRENAK